MSLPHVCRSHRFRFNVLTRPSLDFPSLSSFPREAWHNRSPFLDKPSHPAHLGESFLSVAYSRYLGVRKPWRALASAARPTYTSLPVGAESPCLLPRDTQLANTRHRCMDTGDNEMAGCRGMARVEEEMRSGRVEHALIHKVFWHLAIGTAFEHY